MNSFWNVFIFLIIYVAIVNIIGFSLMGIDKSKARKKKWRIPEATLFMVAIIGGSVGSIIGMYTFRHKTRHASFTIGMPIILILQIVLILFVALYLPFEFTTI